MARRALLSASPLPRLPMPLSADLMGAPLARPIPMASTNLRTRTALRVVPSPSAQSHNPPLTSWAQTSAPDICRSQCWYDNVIKVDPTNKDIVYLGGSAAATFAGSALSPEWVMRSMNGTTGGTFSPAIPPVTGPTPALPHVDEHALAFFQATSGALAGKVRLS